MKYSIQTVSFVLLSLLMGMMFTPATASVLPNSNWRYLKGTAEASSPDPAAWREAGFNDSTWLIGQQPFFYENGSGYSGNTTLSDMNGGYTCIFMRQTFDVANPADILGLILDIQSDDGCIVWINGTEITRVNMPSGDIPFSGTSNGAAGEPNTETTNIANPSSLIQAGINVIAVQAFNASLSGSSDFLINVTLAVDTPPVVALTSPTQGQEFTVPGNILLAATASDTGGSIQSVSFFSGEDRIGADTTAPYSFTWTNALDGPHVLTAQATDNTGNTVASAPVSITVNNPNPPAIQVASATTNEVTVIFSKRLSTTANNAANYTITGNSGNIAVNEATLGGAGNLVTLDTAAMELGETYTLTVNNVEDLAGQPIALNSQIQFTVQSFTLVDIGAPSQSGTLNSIPAGFVMTGSGTNIAGVSDQFSFSYVERLDDFDLSIKVDSLALSDPWAQVGLMAREATSADGRYAAALATPSVNGAFMQYRAAIGGATTSTGKFPATYPNMRLRLKRSGDTFTAYAGVDGVNWQQLGSVQLLAAARPMLVGLALASGSEGATTSSQFSSLRTITGTPGASVVFNREPLGPSSRRGPFVISEIMYNPRTVGNFTNNSLEFIEIFNSTAWEEEIGGYRISGAADYTFEEGTMIPSGGFLVVARDPQFVESHYGISGVLGPWEGIGQGGLMSTNGLPNDDGRVRLRGWAGEVLQEVNYEDQDPWPVAGDNTGHSIVLARASLGEDNPKAWTHSYYVDGSPGQDDPFGFDPLDAVMINEFLAHTDDPQQDFIELYNHSNVEVDISGAWLSDDPEVQKYQIPPDSKIPPREFAVFLQSTLGFALSSAGEEIYFMNAAKTRVIDAIKYEGQANGISTGRYPDGSPYFSELTGLTAGSANDPMLIRDIVINEFMYSPISGDDDDEYLELFNKGAAPIDVGGWRFTSGISMTIPSNTVIQAGGYLVVAQNAANIIGKYPQLNGSNTIGDYNMNLGNGGERIALSMPDEIVNFFTNEVTMEVTAETNTIWIVVDEVTYEDGGRWGWWSDGGGSSLELKDPNTDNRFPANWADSDETAKAPWTTIEGSAAIGETLGTSNTRLFIYNPGGIGECLIDDVEVRNFGAGNSVANSGFESGLSGWVLQGSHDHSRLENEGYMSNQSLRLRAASRGDNGPNRIYVPLSPAASGGAASPVTFRLKARWLRGWPDILMLLQGDGMEVGGRLEVPSNLGSPGLANSRAVANAGPAIWDVSHSPILPAAGDPVVVTARAVDPTGVASLTLRYRNDTANGGVLSLAMVDTGTSGDQVAGDGIYSATIPSQPANTVVAFYVEARDTSGALNTFPQELFPTAPDTRVFPTDAVTRELVVRWGEQIIPGGLGNYRVWLTRGNRDRWANRTPQLNNAVMDGTFVYNNYRVIYNMKPQYAGSPWHRGQMTSGPDGGQRVDFDIEFPRDDRFLGVTDAVWNNPGNPGGTTTSDRTAQSEQAVYRIFQGMNIHYNYRRYVHVFVNGSQRSTSGNIIGNFIFEDSQQPNGQVIRQWFPNDTDGDLYKIEDEFWFPDNGFDFSGNDDADLARREIPGTSDLQISAYRFAWRKRGLDPGDSQLNYTTFETLVNTVSPPGTAANAPIPSVEAFGAIADIENWMRIFATQHAVYNWDGYSFDRGKNAYMYVPENGKSVQMTWDIDFSLGIDRGPNPNLFQSNDPRIVQMWAHPMIRRAYIRAYQDILDGPMRTEVLYPILEKKERALRENGVTVDGGQLTTIRNWIRDIIPWIQNNAAAAGQTNFAINGPASFTTDNNLIIVSGTAPAKIRDIYLNGEKLNVAWSFATGLSPVAWRATIVAQPGLNELDFTAVDSQGEPLPQYSANLNVTYTGQNPEPVGTIVFNEIMYNPTATNAGFVEIHNTSPNASFDISGWEINGLNFEFPQGTILTNGEYMIVTKSLGAFAGAYGSPVGRIFEFDGVLDLDGETLTLIKPGVDPDPDVEVDKIRYEPNAPWIASANGTGRGLQLIDPEQDNSRSSNWGDGAGWQPYTYTGPIGFIIAFFGTNLTLSLPGAGEVIIDDVELVLGPTQGAGPNLLGNPGFETGVLAPWEAAGNHASTFVTSEAARTGNHALHLTATGIGSNQDFVRQSLAPAGINTSDTTTIYTFSFWFLAIKPGSMNFNISPTFRSGAGATEPPIDVTPTLATPGTLNTADGSLPPYDPVWLNEVQPNNATGAMDSFGERDAWIELHNNGTSVVNLEGYYLADNYDANPTQWAFPAGASIAPNEFKVVWMDGQTGQSSLAELHSSVTLDSATGSVALVRLVDGQPQVTDYLNYAGLLADEAYGDFPDGQPFKRVKFTTPTPGAVNIAKPADIFINEWMAQNTAGLIDPADGNFEDWFELYNAGSEPVDLAGYYLTDDLGDDNKFLIPPGYVIPGNGYLLVFADNDPEQNSTNSMDLHVNFGLDLAGEEIGLFSPDRIEVDSVTFGPQDANKSEGRLPDGSDVITALNSPTPGEPNVNTGDNTAPTLSPIADATITLGQTLSFTALATDPESPPQILTFSLLSGAPAGAVINPSSGQFVWTPTPAQAGNSYPITVRVRDNGAPIQTDDESFNVTVVFPPAVDIVVTDGNVSLSFPTRVGKTYRVLYADSLTPPIIWLPMGADQVATGTSIIINDAIGANTERYYQVFQVD